jgi:hypothetical protein
LFEELFELVFDDWLPAWAALAAMKIAAKLASAALRMIIIDMVASHKPVGDRRDRERQSYNGPGHYAVARREGLRVAFLQGARAGISEG